MDFSTLALHGELKRGLAGADFISTMPVQEQVIANAFSGRDLYVQSQTGTGKTLAYLIVIMQRLVSEPALAGRKALIMVPTRELAVQVEEEAKLLGKHLPFKTGAFYGGVGYGAQQQMLRDDAQILIGTPGRVLDLNASGHMNLMNIAFLVLDEADRMFDMGFYPDLRKLAKVVPPADRRQTMLFSATLNTYVKNLAYEYTKEPIEIEIEPEHITVNEIEQTLYHVPASNKMKLLLGILRRENPESAIIFCNTKRYTEVVAKRLRENGIKCDFISGDLPQQKRLLVINNLKAGKIHFLVATDIAARGLDVEGLALVVNYDLPGEAENYVHRIGRTARAGKTGKAVTFASEQDVYELADIEKYIGKKIPALVASEDLYGEEVAREREPAQARPRQSRQSAPPRQSPPPRHTAPAGEKPRRNSQRPSPQQAAQPPRQDTVRRRAKPQRGEPKEAAVLGLPLDERMAYYKNKYADKRPAEAASYRNGGETEGAKGNPRKRRRRNAEAAIDTARTAHSMNIPSAEALENRQEHQAKKHSRRGGQGRAAGKPNETPKPANEQTPVSEPRKKGFFSNFAGIFKKKK
ncbi:MAG: DEAD/DEAH box helicase [Spirochaetaceae bacterium]|jgi:ATP-dependent RNA helicase RhlB|nr:DEAD/DEAH box helicase [Spirochaetaceae bacterium]